VRTTVRISGLRELDHALGELPKATARRTLVRVLTRAAEPVAETARQLAPDDPETGAPDLRSSIAVSTKLKNAVGKAEFAAVMREGGTRSEARAALIAARKGTDASFAEVFVGPGKGGAHGVLQEFGTVNHGPQPFMRPAWERHKGQALEIIKRELGPEIEKTAARIAKRRAAGAARGA
jgi:HK97 gp10 family phage protein